MQYKENEIIFIERGFLLILFVVILNKQQGFMAWLDPKLVASVRNLKRQCLLGGFLIGSIRCMY
jgi:hypothetical protein